MTPLGEHLRKLRLERGITQKEMADGIGVSPAYLSALEHGKRGKPNWALLQRIVGYLNVIWDEADKVQYLADLSDPRVIIDTTDLPAKTMATANLFAMNADNLSEEQLDEISRILLESSQV